MSMSSSHSSATLSHVPLFIFLVCYPLSRSPEGTQNAVFAPPTILLLSCHPSYLLCFSHSQPSPFPYCTALLLRMPCTHSTIPLHAHHVMPYSPPSIHVFFMGPRPCPFYYLVPHPRVSPAYMSASQPFSRRQIHQ